MAHSRTTRIARIALFTALIAASAFARLPNPLFPAVDITLQTAFVLLAGLTLGAKDGTVAVLLYILMGLIGIPVFTRGGGISYVLQPTFGYLLGMVLAAFVTGFTYKKLNNPGFRSAVLAGTLGTFAVYLIGLPYLYLISTFYLGNLVTVQTLFVSCFALFLPGDIVTMLGAAYIAPKLQKK